MVDATRLLLDQLMGKDRNLAPEARSKRKRRWTDPDVCTYYLNGFCPHDLFTNTKSDLGPCNKDHNNGLQEDFQREVYKVRLPLQQKFYNHLKELVDDIDKKIEKGNERLTLKAIIDKEDPDYKASQEKIGKLNENICTLLQQMEDLGNEGKIEESQALLNLVENLRKEQKDLEEKPLGVPFAEGSSQEKRMNVCPICAAFLVVGDAEQRVQAHLNGKLHQGYKIIRDKLAEMDKERDEQRALAKEGKDDGEAANSSNEAAARNNRSRSQNRDRERDRDRDRDREKRRDRGDRSRDRDRDRDRGGDRGGRGRRDSYRDRDQRKRSRSRSGSRDRGRDRRRSDDRRSDD